MIDRQTDSQTGTLQSRFYNSALLSQYTPLAIQLLQEVNSYFKCYFLQLHVQGRCKRSAVVPQK